VLSLNELRRAARVLAQRLEGTRLHRIVQPDEFRLILRFHGPGGDPCVLISCSPEFARLSASASMPEVPQSVPSFAEYLRAHLSRGVFGGMQVESGDRQLRVALHSREGRFSLILSILGARSNVYLLDPQGNLVHAMRALTETRRELVFGAP
jgi:predicted ribosome quality control (RQC) complex YloA/Tae2 family protein